MAPAGVAAIVVTAAVVGVAHRRALRTSVTATERSERPIFGAGLLAVLAATAFVLVLPAPALPVAAVGVAAVRTQVSFLAGAGPPCPRGARPPHPHCPLRCGGGPRHARAGVVGAGGPAVPSRNVGDGAVAALLSVLVNNLPAASLLASRAPPKPFALLIGLNIGPNLFVTGSLAWALWWRAARTAQARPSLSGSIRLGLVAAPLSMAAALTVLTISGRQ